MKRTIKVIYDGEVFRPQEPLDLQPHTSLSVTIEAEPQPPVAAGGLLKLAGKGADDPIDEMLAYLDQARTTTPLARCRCWWTPTTSATS